MITMNKENNRVSEFDNWVRLTNADRSDDAVRLKSIIRPNEAILNLSACATPDNVKMKMNNNGLPLANADRSNDAVRFKDAVRLKNIFKPNEAILNLSACATPDNVKVKLKMNNGLPLVIADRSNDAVRLKN